MAGRAVALSPAAGLAALVLLALFAPVAALLAAPGGAGLSAGDWAAVRFTLLQAVLSAALSCLLAVPLARALARRRFPGRRLLVLALGAPFILPAIVAVMGLVAVFGRAGWVNFGLGSLGLPPLSIYGLQGVVLAHVFFNLPLATRILLFGWDTVPAERLRLAASLGFAPADTFRHIEAPMLRAVLPGAFVAVFAICLTSFAVALTLGGGPRATTVELAIYQALRFDFDLAGAARLALVQAALAGAALALAARVVKAPGWGGGLDRPWPAGAPGGWRRAGDAAVIASAAAFLMLPIAAVATRGAPGLAALPAEVWAAAGRSLAVALAATLATLALALPLALAAARGGRLSLAAGTLPLAVSGLVLGTGLFLMLRPFVRPADFALPVTVMVNALLALPFAVRVLLPGAQALAGQDRLCATLGLQGWDRARLVTLPRLARPLGFAAGIAAALAMGDLGVIALFADEGGATLPLAVSRLMGAYRMEAAAGAALLLVALSFALFAVFDGVGRRAGT
ncbi:MAG TPA: thiamine/thiamine pyrophosphate ABC transporter permease ThiP [Paracoccaceae bacterium]|nr:thiamine/thiamine pyrophosphate ABC transporter permease ThiP [Paracoccaceae bacterium]